ncbi:response regulator transcription factor [Alistipes putredinis]|uniref:response regulator transcription factor n=1 Tax=Alistipes putredinis TaxID=28117 RepID=UPI0039969E04
MRAEAGLTQRETQIAELLAWGAAKKEVADRLSISPRTVENTARNIYSKIGIQKATELCVWWFCTHCGVSFDLSPIKRTIIACFFLAIILPIVRPRRHLPTVQKPQGCRTYSDTKNRKTAGIRIRFLGTIKGKGYEATN